VLAEADRAVQAVGQEDGGEEQQEDCTHDAVM
jgi:hypothetical protein